MFTRRDGTGRTTSSCDNLSEADETVGTRGNFMYGSLLQQKQKETQFSNIDEYFSGEYAVDDGIRKETIRNELKLELYKTKD